MKNERTGFDFRRLIFNDKYLIITSLLLAVLIWIVTSLNIGTSENKTLRIDVPIKLGDEVSEQLGMQYYTLQDTIELNVTISGAKYAIGQVTESDLNIRFDTSNVNRTGEQSIPILVSNGSNNLDFTVSSTYPSSVDAYFDVNETRTFSVNVNYDDTAIADGYTFGTPVLNEDKVVISGPKTYVDKIEKAYVDVEFPTGTKLTEPYSAKCDIQIDGAGVESSYLTFASRSAKSGVLENIAVTLPVLKIKELPVEVEFEDMPSDFNENTMHITYSVDSIDAGVLDSASIQSAVIGTIPFGDLKVGMNTFEFDVTDLDGITVIDKDLKQITASVYINSVYTAKMIEIKPSDISITGVDENTTATLSQLSTRKVLVYVPNQNKDDTITVETKCVVDGDESGRYPLSFTVRGNNKAWVCGHYSAYIELTAKE